MVTPDCVQLISLMAYVYIPCVCVCVVCNYLYFVFESDCSVCGKVKRETINVQRLYNSQYKIRRYNYVYYT